MKRIVLRVLASDWGRGYLMGFLAGIAWTVFGIWYLGVDVDVCRMVGS